MKLNDSLFSFGIFGQNLNDKSQTLDGISIFDKRIFISIGCEWK